MHLVDDLDEKYRLPLELLARGASYEESASLLGIPEPTLRKRIERGRKYLWEKVNENDGNKDGLV
jgi:DNA-directed RNA polymerase specialized sigma24 family protein